MYRYIFIILFFSSFLSNYSFAVGYDELRHYLGYCGRPNTVQKQGETWHHESLRRVYKYRLDSWGTRYTDISNNSAKMEHLLLLGGSNTFGEHLHGNETISSLIAQKRSQIQVYNYSYRGWGPSSLLTLFKFFPIEKDIIPKRGRAYYFLYSSHINRVIGSSCFYRWSYGMGPYYKENEFGDLKYFGLFKDQVLRSKLLMLFSRMNLFFKFNRCFPRITKGDMELTIKILKELEKEYRKALPSREFYVVLPPVELRLRKMNKYYDGLIYYAKKHHLKLIILSLEKEKYRTRERYRYSDGHLNPLGAKLLASLLLKLLK